MPEPLKPQGSSVRSGYDRWAAIYDREANPLIALEEPVVREALGDVAGLAVLDLGCGTGRHSVWLASAGATVTGVDFSEGMLEEARRKPGAEAVRFLAHDLHQPLPFADGDLRPRGERPGPGAPARTSTPSSPRRAGCCAPGGRAVVSAMHPAMFLKGVQARFTDPDERREGAAGQRRALDRRLRHGRGARGLRARGDRRAGARRRLRRALPAGREVRGLADAGRPEAARRTPRE